MRFVLFMADKTEQPLPEPANCVGYIYRFHCPHRPDMPVIKDWQHVQTLMFPHKDPVTGAGPEAKVRWTPELIGPIALAAAGAWPDGVVRAEQMQGKTVKIASLLPVGKPPRISEVEIVLDEATGWRVTRKRNADDLLPDDIHSGNCQQEFAGADASGLELQVAGGRPLARLMGWPAPGAPHTAPQSVQWYQRDGNPQGVACTWELLQ
jgi:hypothetical protein